ncbi:peptide ABC transporter substrate-binding protein [Arthrobacter sp. G119Y2]|uniref:peptide ABC transporter substrate-binding protein n=1 Tax=Arthrobacter sp. G119Y2 TaxID=3134965 RepID=UPI003119E46A
MPRDHKRLKVSLTAAIAAAALLLTGCSASSGGQTETSGGDASVPAGVDTDTVNYALPPNATPNWILPIGTAGKMATHNSSITQALWSPLMTFDGSKGEMKLDLETGIADKMEYSEDGTSVTFHLRDMSWSDGTPITTRDVEFWFNLIGANKEAWGGYKEGRLPDNITNIDYTDEKTFTLTFDKVYNQDWLSSTQLISIKPLPHHAWAKTADDAPAGDGDRTDEGAKAIFGYLVKSAEDMSSYASNPLWQTVSGPFALGGFDNSGKVTLVKNDAYSGKDTAQVQTVNLLPFTSADAEVNLLRSKGIDYGYIPTSLMDQKSQFESNDYVIDQWEGWAVTYMPYNFNNPEMGNTFKQLYVRQALQSAIDQETISKTVWKDGANPVYGPVPQDIDSSYLSDEQKNNPYPFDLDKAKQLFADHGWEAGSDGVLVCEDAGIGNSQCGEGVEAGTRMDLTMMVQSGSDEADKQFAAMQSSFRDIGVAVTFDRAPLNTVLNRTVPCEPDAADCSWQFSYFGAAGSWYFPAYPTGERIFATGASVNFGNYSNTEADQLMGDALETNDPATMQKYSALLAEDLPVMWLPNPVYQVSVIREGLTGTTQDPTANFFPQRWGWNN